MMNFKMKALVAAVAVAVTGVANAAIAPASTGNGELFLTVWDETGNRSYVRDLGIAMDNFGTQNVTNAVNPFAVNVDLTSSPILPINADANWATFASTGNVSSFKWMINAFDAFGGSGPGQLRALYTTKANDEANIALPGNLQNNTNTGLLINSADTFISAVNGVDNTVAINNSQIVTDPASAAYGKNLFDLWGVRAASITPFALVGESQNFMYLARSSTSNTAEALIKAYGNTGGLSSWTLAANGDLQFNPPVAPVPEPGEWAMLLAGLAVVGSMARRRLSSHV